MSARICDWCRSPLPAGAAPRTRFCHRKCRQAHWRARAVSLMEGDARPLRVGYFDPPFPGMSRKYYGDESTYGGEVDHRALASLVTRYDGWAISTSESTLSQVLPLFADFPERVRIAPWVKPIGVSSQTRGPHNTWEPVIYKPARLVRPGKRDWLRAMPARGGGSELVGRKPIAFYRWLFELLGMAPQDSFHDLYPGSKMGSRAWAAVSGSGSRRVPSDAPDRETMDRGRGAIGMPPITDEQWERLSLLQERDDHEGRTDGGG